MKDYENPEEYLKEIEITWVYRKKKETLWREGRLEVEFNGVTKSWSKKKCVNEENNWAMLKGKEIKEFNEKRKMGTVKI